MEILRRTLNIEFWGCCHNNQQEADKVCGFSLKQ